MESILSNSIIFSKFSTFKSNPNSPHRFRKTLIITNKADPKSLLKSPFLTSPLFLTPSTSKFRITPSIKSHFQRSKRRNSLRKKLEEQEQVRNSNLFHPFEIEEKLPTNSNYNDNVVEHHSLESDFSNFSSDSVRWNDLISWASQFKEDNDFWGVGSGSIFTVYQNRSGNVDRVRVDEEEIIRRSGIDSGFLNQEENAEKIAIANSKISRAMAIAREIEIGSYKLPENSSIAKFVVTQGKRSKFGNRGLFKHVGVERFSFLKISRVGFVVICGAVILWAVKRFFTSKDDSVKMTEAEKEMLRRKIKMRSEKEMMEKSNVEILPNVADSMASIARPGLDKDELMRTISKARVAEENLSVFDCSSNHIVKKADFDDKIMEIQDLARVVRMLEQNGSSKFGEDGETSSEMYTGDSNVDSKVGFKELGRTSISEIKSHVDDLVDKEVFTAKVKTETREGKSLDFDSEVGVEELDHTYISETRSQVDNMIKKKVFMEKQEIETHKENSLDFVNNLLAKEPDKSLNFNEFVKTSDHENAVGDSSIKSSKNEQKNINDPNGWEISSIHSGDLISTDMVETKNGSSGISAPESKKSIKMNPRIIRSVKEAREYLSQKRGFGTKKEIQGKKMQNKCSKKMQIKRSKKMQIDDFANEELNGQVSQQIFKKDIIEETFVSVPGSDMAILTDQSNEFTLRNDGNRLFEDSKPLTNSNNSSMQENVFNTSSGSSDSIDAVSDTEAKPVTEKESWLEMNFDTFQPIVDKIGVGFRENYMVAREKVREESSLSAETSYPEFKEDEDDGLEWMKDDGLREIVFQVRENELAGRDPFHLMDAKDKNKFFEGLEKKVEKENIKLQELHEWVHSKVENLDYGADGISLYDPPEKIIPRWKGPSLEKDPEFLKDYMENHSKIIGRKREISQTSNVAVQKDLQKSELSPDGISTSSATNLSSLTQQSQHQSSTNPKTVIEGSDGSIKAGKKSGKEYWQHTKKWSQEFLDMYNAETDPEIKSVMKDMGKDLDRWITEKEIQETADLMTLLPKRKREYIEKKLDKFKREVAMFGQQAVVSKYREYADEREEDYLWWLDLPFVLCIELYTMEDNVQEVGFYSLEMAEDMELDPKQYHVIAFQDPGDSKNFCYILQAHLEILGNGGSAFVVARPPKEAFREAKANGFNVTVIRKGQLQLNVDQTLEEVESEITEIGSKMYHDKIMRERSIDMRTLMKGVFGQRKSSRRMPKRMLTKSTKKS